MVAHGNPGMMKNSKFFGVVILIGSYKLNNQSVAYLLSTPNGWPIFNRTMSR